MDSNTVRVYPGTSGTEFTMVLTDSWLTALDTTTISTTSGDFYQRFLPNGTREWISLGPAQSETPKKEEELTSSLLDLITLIKPANE